MAERVFETQELVLNALAGEEIDEPDDLDKKLAMLEKELAAEEVENNTAVTLTPSVAADIVGNWAYPLAKDLKAISDKFNAFYLKNNHKLFMHFGNVTQFEWPDDLEKYLNNLKAQNVELFNQGVFQFQFTSDHRGYVKGGLDAFDCTKYFTIEFSPLYYVIDFRNPTKRFTLKKALNQPPTTRELAQIKKLWGDNLLHHLEHHRNQLKNEP
jgi:hypothetical protein